MLNQNGFNLWADNYDKSVGLSDEENTYPFAGYKRLVAYNTGVDERVVKGRVEDGFLLRSAAFNPDLSKMLRPEGLGVSSHFFKVESLLLGVEVLAGIFCTYK